MMKEESAMVQRVKMKESLVWMVEMVVTASAAAEVIGKEMNSDERWLWNLCLLF